MDPLQFPPSESESALRRVLDELPIPVACCRAEGVFPIVYLNARFVETFGYTLADLPTVGDWFARVDPDGTARAIGLERWREAVERLRRAQGSVGQHEVQVPCKDGTFLHVLHRAAMVEDLLVVSFVDITGHKRMEKELRTAKEDLEATLEALPDLLLKVDADGRILEFRSSNKKLLFLDPPAFLGKNYQEVLPPAASETIGRALEEAWTTGHHHGAVYSLPLPDGDVWFELSVAPMGELGGERGNLVCLARDITERLKLVEQLRESEERYRQLAESISDVVWILDLDDLRFTYMSPWVEQQVGLTPEEAIARGLSGGLTPESQVRVQQAVARGLELVASGDTLALTTLEIDQYHKDGSLVPSEVNVRFLPTPDGRPHLVLGVTRDIRERRAAELRQAEQERQLQEARRLEAVGLLAGGVAHHYNNILASILGYTELLALDPRLAGTPAQETLQVIRTEALRAADLTWKLLTLSERQFTRPEALDLQEALDRAAPGLRSLLGERVGLVLSPAPATRRVRIDPNHLVRLLEHLATNARDAMPGGGCFTLETAELELQGRDAEELRVPPGAYVVLSASDTGTGLDPKTQSHLFEPFFTTKEHGKGTGLGLSVVRGIVRMSGGGLSLESLPGSGTTVRVYLPRVGEA